MKTALSALASVAAFCAFGGGPQDVQDESSRQLPLGAVKSEGRLREKGHGPAAWFVDGFHGGMYGHYPRETYTGYICDQLDRNPEWSIGLEIEPATWDVVAELAPRDLERLRAYSKTPRVEFTNPTYAQSYLWNITGESILRQFSIGLKTLRRNFPSVEIVTYACEEPCFTSCLPAVLKEFGFKYAVLRCPDTCWGGYPAAFGGELVNMVGPDGTRILAVPRPACEELEPNSVWQTTSWRNGKEYLEACRKAGIKHPVGMTYQDAGWRRGPWLGTGNKVRNGSVYTTWRRYFEEIADRSSAVDWKFSQEDVMPNLMWGSTVMNVIGRQVRAAENALVRAEKAASLAALAKGAATDCASLEDGWRTLLLAQHHDSWIVPYNGLLEKGMTWADWIGRWTSNAVERAEKASDAALAAIAGPDANCGARLFVMNTQARDRTELVTFPSTDEGPAFDFPASVPSFGVASYSRAEAANVAQSAARCRVVSRADGIVRATSGAVELVIDSAHGGAVVSLRTADGREYADKGGERRFCELRGHFYDEGSWHSSADGPAELSVEGDGKPVMTVKAKGTIAGSPFTLCYELRGGDALVRCSLKVDWRGNPGIGEFRHHGRDRTESRRGFCDDRYKLNVLFPTSLSGASLSKNAPFDVCESKLDHTWFGDWRDIRNNVVLGWLDESEGSSGAGLAVFTDHTGAYSYGPGFPLALTAQYSGGGLWGRDYRITAPLEMRFAFLPHKGRWDAADVPRADRDLNEPCLVRLYRGAEVKRRSYLSLGGKGYELSAFVPNADGSFDLRVFNASGDESPCELRVADDVIRVALPRFGFKTIRR